MKSAAVTAVTALLRQQSCQDASRSRWQSLLGRYRTRPHAFFAGVAGAKSAPDDEGSRAPDVATNPLLLMYFFLLLCVYSPFLRGCCVRGGGNRA